MTLRQAYAPLQPEFDAFLFATVGAEINGMPLSTISMLTQLGFDPWREAGRLASLAKREAIEQLTLIIARLPGTRWLDAEQGEIAGNLIELLPQRAGIGAAATPRQPRHRIPGYWKNSPDRARYWLIGLIFVAAVLVTLVAQHGLPFSEHHSADPPSTIGTPPRL